ncbi:MBL fold metallo-hydrolase [Orbus sturtevantii]|uniref:MBL fold metallo-hydrolase n=1 Tax=Orbus sturtevantii TaxID=3074109 RepID=UPI00370D21E3
MKLVVLVDNNTLIDRYYYGEPAVCYYIEDGNNRLLLDVGYSDIFIKNAELLSIDLTQVDTIVLSHGHNDHTRGLKYLVNKIDLKQIKVVAHPDAFKPKIFAQQPVGAPFNAQQLTKMCSLQLSKTPINITSNITFLGEIPSLNEFEQRQQLGTIVDEQQSLTKPDYVMDDSALVYRGKEGLFIITGCSHSGICNIVEYAKQVCNEQKVAGIIGGFHLLEVSEQLHRTIEYFVENNIKLLYPCHCVSFSAKAELNSAIPIEEVGVSLTIEID